ncbi:hypothetical protein BC939DRAFT_437328 [Gamsiella multidivaricata]|uniref:uncharacterized protein n=1 Tax=Gamsiella multidivaricata TaxID=101098 RepID=UPI0022205DFE|nr:uncharacterized protein BC939DRAFT_437322 [Gamsiella multidivaricata]XP_051417012.1 uncharacterized protein BC939DRAFT_437328 [Gamsiella multidivaricata]KAI7831529.1 hypothetical protein BC939DRAFT_437322 [Gamsiella multidivaricata]KAI7831530.1 hypothetical protein BC939DRAFT_437328 [Gamsiella multidivaricata]
MQTSSLIHTAAHIPLQHPTNQHASAPSITHIHTRTTFYRTQPPPSPNKHINKNSPS